MIIKKKEQNPKIMSSLSSLNSSTNSGKKNVKT